MRFRYPRHKFPWRDSRELHITLHGENIVDSFNKQVELVRGLVSFQKYELVTITMTPSREDQVVPDEMSGIAPLVYEDFVSKEGHNWFSVRVGSSSSLASTSLLNARAVEYEFGYQQNTVENQRSIRLLKDLEAHSSINADVFVTEDYDALAFRDRLQDLIAVLILSVEEALDYLDVHLKRQNRFVCDSHRTVIEGKRIYYWERLCELLPSFQKTWITCAIATTSLRNGEQLHNYLDSLSTRIIYMLESKDRIASQFYLKSDNKVQDEMLRELNYFMTLATGSFDALAWLFRYFYQFRTNDSEKSDELRRRITLVIKSGKHTNSLVNHVEHVNKRLGSYLRSRDVQNLINIFYPSRDSIQHRHPLRGAQYARARAQPGSLSVPQSDMDKGYSLAVIDADTEKAISQVDSDDKSDYFTLWGVRKLGADTFLEPYKFVLQALRCLMDFYEHVLHTFDVEIGRYLTPDDLRRVEDNERETNLERPKYLIPFLLRPVLPPISPRIPRIPISGTLSTGQAKSDISIASYGNYPMYIELLK
jgi:hypothetical protein